MLTDPPLPIAVVGLGGVFPGALDLDSFQHNLRSGVCATRDAPAGRWALDPTDAYNPRPSPDHCYSTRGCFVEGFSFNPIGLALDPATLAALDPVYQLTLHAGRQAWSASESQRLDRTRVGVILAAIALPTDGSSRISRHVYGRSFERALVGAAAQAVSEITAAHWLNARVAARPAGLLAAALGLGGGSFTLDAACASSLYAVKLACDALRSGRCDAMLAGGVSRPECLYTQMGFSQLRALSASGVCRPFDARADGLVVGEGAGIVVLKRVDDAISAGDRIHAVIRGCGLSNDVAGSLLAADSQGQLRAMRQAYQQAGWQPTDVDLIECHGTGTPLGDAAEIASMRELWGGSGWRAGQCPIGSVKSNIGHLLTAAGAAGLIKTLLAMRDWTIPPSLNFERAAPTSGLNGSPFRVPGQAAAWERRDENTPRRAGVSGFGFGGINAHLLVEEYDPAVYTERASGTAASPCRVEAAARVDVAVVGMDARFGQAQSLREFRELQFSGRSAIAPRSADRWRGCDEIAAECLGVSDLPGAYIDSISTQVGAFRLPPNEIAEVLPQQLLMLHSVAAALKDAGLSGGAHAERTSVIIGMSLDINTTNYHLRWSLLPRAREWARQLGLELTDAQLNEWIDRLRDESGPALTPGRVVGALGNIIASRIAREFAFGGPSYAVSSEESSGITALDIAMQALQLGEIDVAVVGAVDLPGDARSVLAAHAQRPYSKSHRVRPFDPAADGTLPGEGAVAIVLRRLPDAVARGDRVYATVRGVGFAGGAGDQTPDAAICRRAIRRAHQAAKLEPRAIGYIETHGSGDPTEDAAEAAALNEVFTDVHKLPIPIGTAKPMIGHTGAAAGLASVVKTCLCLYHRMIPALAADGPRRSLLLDDCFEIADTARLWLADEADGPRRASVNVLSRDGGCAHVVLEAAHERADRYERMRPMGSRALGAFTVTADDPRALLFELDALRAHCAASDASVERSAITWLIRASGTADRRHTIAMVATSTQELWAAIELAEQHIRSRSTAPLRGQRGVYYSPEPLGPRGQVAFVFPGSGSHYPSMGRETWTQWPSVIRALESETRFLRTQMDIDVETGDTAGLIRAQVAHGIAMSNLLRRLGMQPAAAIGYSLGETTAMFATRAWRDRDEMFRRLLDSPLFQSQLAGRCDAARSAWGLPDGEPVDWCIVVVNRPAGQVREALKSRPRMYLLIVNTPDECVIGGQRREIDRVVETLGCNTVEIPGASTVHCPIARRVESDYREFHLLPTTPPPGVALYSAARQARFEVTRESAADSITAQAMSGFDFPAVIQQAYEDGVRVFVEPGPGASCTRMIGKILAGRPHVACHATAAGESETASILKLVAAMCAERVIPNLAALYPDAAEFREQRAPASAAGRCIVVPTGGKPPRPSLPAVSSAAPAHASAVSAVKAQTVDESPITPAREKAARALSPKAASCSGLAAEVARTSIATADAHNAFLRFSQGAMTGMGQTLALEAKLLEYGARPSAAACAPIAHRCAPSPALVSPPQYSREMCMEFAIGSLARVLGPEFAPADSYPVRVRLPDEPLMLVDRILEVDAVIRSMTGGRVVTEHDVLPGAWYLDGDRAPVCITVEAGQADLFLCSYLGIDLAVQGIRAYRLLDATVTFHRGLPRTGETVRYDICIDRFVRQAETYLFFFRFEGSIDGRPLLTMAEGCAGFFTKQEIAESGGIVETPEQRAPMAGTRPADWRPLAPMQVESYDESQIDALRAGGLAACFGDAFANLAVADPARIPGGRMRLVHRVTRIEPDGGRFGLGLIRAEADIAGDEWFLRCHFVDDMVMPGTLMYECCMHTLRIFLLRMGWVTEQSGVCYVPVTGVASKLTCRGPVTPETKVVTYEIHIKEIGYGPEPYAIAYALMYADGEKIVRFTDMSIKLTGASREQLESLWTAERTSAVAAAAQASPAVAPVGGEPVRTESKPAIFDDDRILALAIGKPSDAFGEPYRVFDAERRIARLPGPPYKFLDRITETCAEAWKLEAGGWIEAQYDVPPDAWYFRANRQASMPFGVILEIALQPCGWLAAYLGSALRSAHDMSFRNLGGTATLYEEIFADAGTLTVRVKIKRVFEAGGMLIENFDMQIWREGRVVYDGETAFGFFSQDALANQLGIRDAAERLYVPNESELRRAVPIALDRVLPLSPDELAAHCAQTGESPPGCHGSASSAFPGEGAVLPAGAFLMIDEIESFVPDGGPRGLGFMRGIMHVDPDAWFFKAHFYQDPVVPGSLGLESFLQLLKLAALERWGDSLRETHRFTPILVGHQHTWVYRGQITPRNRRVEVEVVVTEVCAGPRMAIMGSAFLKVDGLVIYEMPEFGIALKPVHWPHHE
jgi:PfaB family protein